MPWIDERTEDEKKEYSTLITAIDKYMSGWGCAEGGLSRVAWAVKAEDVDEMIKWVENRPEMKNINFYKNNNWNPKKYAHVFISAAKRGEHRALPILNGGLKSD